MLFRCVPAAVVAVVFGVCAAHAQSANDFRGPRELPPAGFTGQQFVDSQGCVFLKAGLSGRVNWVPRVSRDRKQLCGYPPTFARQVIDVVEAPEPVAPSRPAPAAAQSKVVAKAPAPAPVRTATVTAPKPATAMAAKPTTQPVSGAGTVAVAAAPSGAKIGCYRDAPVAERFRLRDGGTIVLCTKGDGDLDHARPPVLVGGRAAVAASGYVERAPVVAKTTSAQAKAAPVVAVPKGYRAAFADDRLNPLRGKGTVAGQVAQDQVWTRDVPAQLVSDVPSRKKTVAGRVQVSTKSTGAAAGAKIYVQAGSFGQPANAETAAGRLAGMGLPVARAKTSKGGATLQIVMAGPFTSQAEARAALTVARRAGFADAFIR